MNQLVMRRCFNLLRTSSGRVLNCPITEVSRLHCKHARVLSMTSSLARESAEQDFKPSEQLAKERYDLRADEDVEKKRARLLYQSRKRGMLENGVILASFADKFLNKMNSQELDQYDRLINLPTNDWDIYYWATKTKPTPQEYETQVMQMLREHIHSKVSNDNETIPPASRTKSILDNRSPEEVIIPAIKKKHDLDIDASEIDLVNYKQDLFDDRIINLTGKNSMLSMTEWRKKRFVQRIRRAISSPVSLRNLSDPEKIQVYTQKPKQDENQIAKSKFVGRDLVDSEYERSMKHHHFLQHLMTSDLTDNALDYDDEAKAWSDMIWHRGYGSADVTIAPSSTKCESCQTKLHCCDQSLNGYIPKELFSLLLDGKLTNPVCQKCKFFKAYNAKLGADVTDDQYREIVSRLKAKPSSIVVILIDLVDFPGSIYEGLIDLIGTHHNILICGNKLDLIPCDSKYMIKSVAKSLRYNINRLRVNSTNLCIDDLMVLSARTGFGLESLVTRILYYSEEPKDVYILGSSNSGKSTLFSALLQSDLASIRDCDLLSRVSIAELPGKLNMLKFPTNYAEGWEIGLKQRKMKAVERDLEKRQRSLISTTKIRQADMPHMSMLIDRLEFELPPPSRSKSLVDIDGGQNGSKRLPILSDDHPMKHISKRPALSADSEEFPDNGFCYQYPSTFTKDQLHDLLTDTEKLEVFTHETISPRKYSIRPLQSIFIGGLARLDLLTSTSSIIITIFTSKYLPIHVISTKKADEFYNTFLGTPYLGIPFGNKDRMKVWPGLATHQNAEFNIKGGEYEDGAADIVLSSTGWALVNVGKDQECFVRAYTPEARGIFYRDPPVSAKGRGLVKGKKIRDTPLFRNSNYKIDLVTQ